MKIYQAEKKSSVAFLGVVSVLVGGLFAMVGIVPFVQDLIAGELLQHSRNLVGLMSVAVGGGAVYLGWLYAGRRAYEVRLPGDGSVELAGAFRHVKVAGSELLELRRQVANVSFEDRDARELRVRSRQGTMLVPWFDGIEQLIGDVQAQNPHVAVTGAWPGAG